MYKLSYFRAVNVIGFISGLGRKNFVLDLKEDPKHNLFDKDILTIVGDNATGKSTFLSLIHPTHTPSDDRTKFIVPGKEGSLIRVYEGDDGSVITTKCIYKPKPDGSGHMPKCFLSLKRPDDKEEIEMNPSGNVSSYTDLLYTYFGINKDYINFASYSDAVSSIVKKNGTERKNDVASLIPNTGRFELAYNTINDKYRDLRNMMRNIAQKILSLRDEDSLAADLKRIEKELTNAEIARDEYTRKLAKAEGRVKELSHGKDLRGLMNAYNDMMTDLLQYDSSLMKIATELTSIYGMLDLEVLPGSKVNFVGMEKLPRYIQKYEKKLARSEANVQSTSDRIDKLQKDLFQTEKDINESQSVLFSLQTQDIRELKKTRDEYLEQLNELRYTKHKDQFENMSYDEISTFVKSVTLIDRMVQSLYDEYGDMVSRLFANIGTDNSAEINESVTKLEATIQTKSAKKDSIYRALIEKEQYRKFQDILDQRPRTCHDDTCPFIANALKWQHISGEIAELQEQYKQLDVEIRDDQARVNEWEQELMLRSSAQNMISYIVGQSELLQKYLGVTLQDVYRSISNGTWNSVLDVLKLKSMAAILSEKDLYIRITTQMLPEIEHAIDIATVYGTNRDMIQNQLDRLNSARDNIKEELDRLTMDKGISQKMRKAYENKLNLWRRVDELLTSYKEIATSRVKMAEDAETAENEIRSIKELVEKCRTYENKLDEAKDAIRELTPMRQQVVTDMATLMALKEEKEQVERDFLIVEIMRSIIQPGKGLRKELINIYMYDIYQTANQLLLNTFNGQLYLKEFIITDKEFIIPFVHNGSEGSDISYASSSQQSTIAMALSLAIISKLIDKYGVLTIDEADKALSSENKSVFIDILGKQMKYIGVSQAFVITHSPEYYENFDTGFIAFPGAKIDRKGLDCIEVT